MSGDVEFQKSLDTVTDKARQQNFSDLQHELSGADSGRMSRHMSEEQRNLRGGRNGNSQSRLSNLDLLLQNNDYQTAYNDTFDNLKDTESMVYDAITKSADELHDAKKALEDAKGKNISPEERERLREAVKEAEEKHRKLVEKDAELQAIRDRLQDQDNPPTQEELEDINGRLDGIRADLMRDQQMTNDLTVSEPEQSASLDLSGFEPITGPMPS